MKIKKQFVIREIAGEYVMIPTGLTAQEFNGMININPPARFIWENIEACHSREELFQKVLSEFNVEEGIAKAHLESFLFELLKEGFIEYTDADRAW